MAIAATNGMRRFTLGSSGGALGPFGAIGFTRGRADGTRLLGGISGLGPGVRTGAVVGGFA
jgi:hypothetical protein